MFAVALMMALPACTIEQAVYRLRGDPSVTARFRDVDSGADWPSDLAMKIHIGASGRTYWWLPWNGGSDGQQHLASTADVGAPGWHPPDPDGGPRPLGDVRYIGADADYNILPIVPAKGDPAPAHFLIPDLREALWYRTSRDKRDGTERQFFDLVRCDRKS